MFNFNANPEYVPGGVQNFWVSAPTGASGDANGMAAAMNATAIAGQNQPPPQSGIMSSVFGRGFFTISTAPQTMVNGRKEEKSMFNTTKAAVKSTKEFMFPAGGWKFIEPSDVLCLT